MNKKWEPTFDDWSESKVSLSSCELSTHSTSRNEYGVMMQVGEEEDPYAGNGAIFWIDPQHLYLRYDWDQWYEVSSDDKDNCANICKRNTATLILCTMSSIKYHAIRVYHIDKLPEELFGQQSDAPSAVATGTQLEFEFKTRATGEARSDEQADASFLTKRIGELGGHVIAHFSPEPYRSDFYELNGHFIAASYFNHHGDWMADEDSLGGDIPEWFGTKEIAPSPFAIACTIRKTLNSVIPLHIPFHSIVLLNPGCNIINENNHFSNWTNAKICLVRPGWTCNSQLEAIEMELRRYSGDSRPELAEYASRIQERLASVLTKPNGPNY